MRIIRHSAALPAEGFGSVVAIGNFDGIHRGHQAIIAKAAALAKDKGVALSVMTFEPHPRIFFKPDQLPFRLTPLRAKAQLVETLGVDQLFLLRFDKRLASKSAEDFAHDVLVQGFKVGHVVVGDNFFFGKGRSGNPEILRGLGQRFGFGVSVAERVTGASGEAFSSTLVRDYLKAGNPTRAALLLGRYWEIDGRVAHGEKRGRTIGFPTANILLGDILQPAYGVYAVRAALEGEAQGIWHAGVANLGLRPTVGGTVPRLEVHLFDFNKDIYDRHMRVALVDFLRPEAKFENFDALKLQIMQDAARARETLSWESWDAVWPASPFLSGPSEEPR